MSASVDGPRTTRARGRRAVRAARAVICGLACGLAAAMAAPGAAGAPTTTVVVAANPPQTAIFPFVATGVSLAQGQEVLISASGSAYCGNTDACGSDTGPGGRSGSTGAQLRDEATAVLGRDPGPFIAPELTGFSLIARVGGGAIQEVGAGPMRVSGSGELTLAYNDNFYTDNTGSYTVTIVGPDAAPPVLTLPNDVSASATGPDGAGVTFSASATDGVDASVPVTCTPASGATFALGATVVTCTAADAVGHVAEGTFTVTVNDTAPPGLRLPADISASATGPSGAAVPFETSATDVVDGPVPVTCTPASGATFAIGATSVRCTAEDAAGNAEGGSFTVTVTDTVPPALDLSNDIRASATGSGGATVAFETSADDAVDGTVPVSCAPASGAIFAIGATTVVCTAEDAAGNIAEGEFIVTVADAAPPRLTLPDGVSTPATGSAGAIVTYDASATDAVDGMVAVSCTPASGATFAIGSTPVACTAEDAAGNAATASFTVAVIPSPCPLGDEAFLPTLGPWAASPGLSSPCYRLVKSGPNNLVGRGGWLLVDVRFRASGPVDGKPPA